MRYIFFAISIGSIPTLFWQTELSSALYSDSMIYMPQPAQEIEADEEKLTEKYREQISRDSHALHSLYGESFKERFMKLIPIKKDREILYSVYTKDSWDNAFEKARLSELASLIKTFSALNHTINVLPYFAKRILISSEKKIEKVLKTDDFELQSTLAKITKEPRFFYLCGSKNIITQQALKNCTAKPTELVIENDTLWAISPGDSSTIACWSLKTGALLHEKKLSSTITHLLRSQKNIVLCTGLGDILSAEYSSGKEIILTSLAKCTHEILSIAASATGKVIAAGGVGLISVFDTKDQRTTVISFTQKYDEKSAPVELCAIDLSISTSPGGALFIHALSQEHSPNNAILHHTVCLDNLDEALTSHLALEDEITQSFSKFRPTTPYIWSVVHTTNKAPKIAAIDLSQTNIPLPKKVSAEYYTALTPWKELSRITFNQSGTVGIARGLRAEQETSVIILDIENKMLHEIPDEYEEIVPGDVSPEGEITLLGFSSASPTLISLNPRPFAKILGDAATTHRARCFFVALFAAHTNKIPVDFLKPPFDQWKKTFDTLPQETQSAINNFSKEQNY